MELKKHPIFGQWDVFHEGKKVGYVMKWEGKWDSFRPNGKIVCLGFKTRKAAAESLLPKNNG